MYDNTLSDFAKLKIIAVFKTHVDIGFTNLPRKILESYSSTLLECGGMAFAFYFQG